ncbi:hypothetical protein LOD99_4543 [Oopsacas minuta]|uniref:Uncharacterized protein n=1 Tax=Oopsacas minuta TaxID=111878 RepID=A0AAV7JTG8_9METZ|nr:hypothetical protein LOD99_4543 [Oopsacas minuta]
MSQSQHIKVLIVGGHRVGKTTLFCQLVRGQSFPGGNDSLKQSSEYIILNGNLHIEIHDCLVSSPKSLITQTWRNVNAIIYMFSYEDLRSLHEVSVWFRHVKELLCDGLVHQIIVGNKVDLAKISEEESFDSTLKTLCKELSVTDQDKFSVTATTGDGIDAIKARIGEKFREYVTRGPFPDSLCIVPRQTHSGCMCIN